MLGAAIIQSLRQLASVAAVGIHHPNSWHTASGGAAKHDLPPFGRFAGAKVPDRRLGLSEPLDRTVARVEPADFRAAARQLRLEVAVEMVGVGPLRLELPRDFRAGEPVREKNRAVARPGGDVRAAAAVLRVAVGGPEPHGLSFGQRAML